MAIRKSKVLLVDDHPLWRTALAQLLACEPDFDVVGDVSTAQDVRDVLQSQTVDVVVLDVLMPSTSGVVLAAEIRDQRPSCKVFALSVLEDPVMIAAMLRSGASGYAFKTQLPSEIIGALRVVLKDHRYLPPSVCHEDIDRRVQVSDGPLQLLTRREREIFDLLIHGHSNDAIAARLFISRRTVETHRQRIMKKLATHSIVEILRLAAQQGCFAS